ncbi:hypothetical protein MPSEU_000361800 [Mayamaea pseudoterrestris]|nr:hypothetical protein MPSEU_000361800 [Mayamaea pseudoterrestris]
MQGRSLREPQDAAASENGEGIAEPFAGSDTSDDEDTTPLPEGGGCLSWRMDPENSFSDWTIEIVYDTTGDDGVVSTKTDVYHVHKCHLAGDPRKSGYFVSQFIKGGRFAENGESKSRIELNELAAKSFPDLLDYLYCAESTPKISTDNATALSFLSKYFDVPQLRWTVKTFWKRDILWPKACGTYYEHARLLNESKIRRASLQSCLDNIWEIDSSTRLVHVPDASFWLMLGEQIHAGIAGGQFMNHQSQQLSKLVAAFCRHVAVDQETFQKLTKETALPQIDAKAALSLLDIERVLLSPDEANLTSLQERCIVAFSNAWNQIDANLEAETVATLQKQNGRVLSELLVRSLKAAGQRTQHW